ncbi:hypothetical protein DSAG12_00090 [Promethearchaeum syntrophicum]|uniref:DUF998 domain-containing protein n=1 Tax=Promethearchaeum syntrophicum TaxID=2594042 RepID=A0A5B9D5A3_9ARCH|nr:hypothetical protein [Candidatus Prometheoarchaeum syntrophicum]QEE14279.1 hypothetical protein DSAG12_00090 [Candidatus Prometheoarchaeum syntrophicum]
MHNDDFEEIFYTNTEPQEIYEKESKKKEIYLKSGINKKKIYSKGMENWVHFIYTWSILLGLAVVSIIAQAKFPTRFNYFINTISEQGSIILNPIGGIVWRIGVLINGIAHIPHNLLVYKKIFYINPLWSKISTIFALIAAVSFSFVGAIPVDYGTYHNLASIFAFVGYYISAILGFIILASKNSPLGNYLRNSKKALGFLIYFLFSGAGCVFSSILSSKIVFVAAIYPFLEWNYLLAICIWFVSWVYLLPKLKK